MELIDTGINVTSIDPGLVETEFSVVRLGDKEKADAVYSCLGSEALSGVFLSLLYLLATDVAENVIFSATRRSNVQIAQVTLFCNFFF
jgi:3-hydroxy acid dehydrogenase/malonic semialdehyde reductase